MSLNGAGISNYKKLKTELKNNYIMGLDGYLQDLLVVMKPMNKYITKLKEQKFLKELREGLDRIYFYPKPREV